MKYRYRRLFFAFLTAIFAVFCLAYSPIESSAEETKPAKVSAKERSTAKDKKSSKSKSKSKSKAKSTNKSGEKKKSKSSGSSSKFSKAEIARYRAMKFETWESPRGKSELGLPIAEGYAQPYPYGNLMRQYDGNRCRHRGLDIGAVGEKNGGLGTVVNSATPGVITLIGKAGGDVKEFGKIDKRSGTTKRTGKTYPRQILAPGYGVVYPFSRTYGRWRSGTVIVVRVTDGPLKDYTLRYMHLADVRPDLKVGSKIEAGEHIALMGATAIMDSWPHVHIDLTNPEGQRVDPASYIGLQETISHCSNASVSKKNSTKSGKSNKAAKSGKSNKAKSSAKSAKKKSAKTAEVVKRPRQSYVGTQKGDPITPQMRTLSRG